MKKIIILSIVVLLLLVGCNMTEDELRQEMVENIIKPIEAYHVFSNYELEHPGYLSEGRTFFSSESTDFILAYGHDAHAVNVYELVEVKEDQVTIIKRLISDSEHGEELESLAHLENWQEEIVAYLLEHGNSMEEIFFSYDEEQTETEVTVDGHAYLLYPVQVAEKIYYFKKGEGLWIKQYDDEPTKALYGESQKAVRIVE